MNSTVLAVIVAVAVFFLLKSQFVRMLARHAGREALSEVGAHALAKVPEQITLKQQSSPNWRNAAAVEQQVTPLLGAGFADLGGYSVDKMPGVLIRIMFHPKTYVAAHIYDHPRVGSWIEFATRYNDGSSHTLTTLPATGLESPNWVRTIRVDKGIPTDQLYQRFLRERGWHNIKSINPADVVPEFEDAYLKHMIWRQNTGISPEEVAKVASKWLRKRAHVAAAGSSSQF